MVNPTVSGGLARDKLGPPITLPSLSTSLSPSVSISLCVSAVVASSGAELHQSFPVCVSHNWVFLICFLPLLTCKTFSSCSFYGMELASFPEPGVMWYFAFISVFPESSLALQASEMSSYTYSLLILSPLLIRVPSTVNYRHPDSLSHHLYTFVICQALF